MSLVSTVKNKFPDVFLGGFATEFVEILKLAWPVILTSLCWVMTSIVSTIICGHLGKAELDAVVIANSMIEVFGMSICIGFSTACDTYFSNTIGSANSRRTGLYLQRSFVVVLPLNIIITAIYINMEVILRLLGQDPVISSLAADYCLLFTPGIFFESFFLILSSYLHNNSCVYPPLFAGFLGVCFSGVSQYIAIYVLGYDYRASALLTALAYAISFGTEVIYILVSKVYINTWDGWKPVEMFKNFKQFYYLGLAGILMVTFEELAYEIGTIVSGLLGPVQLGAQGIIFQIEILSYMIPMGISIAVNVRAGNKLGGGDAQAAKRTFRVGLLIVFLSASIVSTLFISFSHQLPKIFTNDIDVIYMAGNTMWFLGIFQFFDGIMAVCGGILKACGRQFMGGLLVFIGYYVIGLPLGITLAFLTSLDLRGIWLGLVIGIGIGSMGFLFVVMRTNWTRESARAEQRAGMTDLVDNDLQDKAGEAEEEEDQRSEDEDFFSNDEEKAFLHRTRSYNGDYHQRLQTLSTPFKQQQSQQPQPQQPQQQFDPPRANVKLFAVRHISTRSLSHLETSLDVFRNISTISESCDEEEESETTTSSSGSGKDTSLICAENGAATNAKAGKKSASRRQRGGRGAGVACVKLAGSRGGSGGRLRGLFVKRFLLYLAALLLLAASVYVRLERPFGWWREPEPCIPWSNVTGGNAATTSGGAGIDNSGIISRNGSAIIYC